MFYITRYSVVHWRTAHSTWHLQLKELSLYGYLVVFLFHDLLFLFYRWQRSSKRHGLMVTSAAHPSPPCQHHCWLLLLCIGRWYVGLQLRVWNNIPSDRTQTGKSVWGWYGHFFCMITQIIIWTSCAFNVRTQDFRCYWDSCNYQVTSPLAMKK